MEIVLGLNRVTAPMKNTALVTAAAVIREQNLGLHSREFFEWYNTLPKYC